MVLIKCLLVTAITIISVSAAPIGLLEKRQSVKPRQGTSNGFFYSFWTDGAGSVTYNNGPGGHYSVK